MPESLGELVRLTVPLAILVSVAFLPSQSFPVCDDAASLKCIPDLAVAAVSFRGFPPRSVSGWRLVGRRFRYMFHRLAFVSALGIGAKKARHGK